MMKKMLLLPHFALALSLAVFSACVKSSDLKSEVIGSQGPPAAVGDAQKVTLSSAQASLTASETTPLSINTF